MLCDLTRKRQKMFESPGQEGVWVLDSRVGAAGAASPVEQGVPVCAQGEERLQTHFPARCPVC